MNDNHNQIKPISVRQLAIAGLFIIVVTGIIATLILKRKSQAEKQVIYNTIPPVIKAKKVTSAPDSTFQTMSFNLN